ncbi:MAG: 3'-5' exoribonuclease [Candidatus Omnitrophica bacterium]|nr:3'-5' exoribonuclease [Candidatus Omnitrophota bacterium]
MKRLLNTSLKEIDFAVVDLETTGFSSIRDSVVEVAAVKVKNGRIKDKFQSLIYTDYIPYYATRVHGIDIDMVSDAPSLNTVRNNFREFTQGCILVGHNIKSFDLPFLINAFDVEDGACCVDTLKISRCLFSGHRSHKLQAVARRLGIDSEKYHRALDDAMVTAQVFLEFLNIEKKKFRILKDIVA